MILMNSKGLTLTSTRFTYMDPHGVPSAGDFAMTRSAAVQLEGTEGVKVTDCNFTRLDGNGLIISGYNRNATVLENTFSWIGDNGVVVWGRTNETAANPLEGFDGTDGNHPQHTKVVGNVVREIGIYEKQTSWYFQAKAAESVVLNNVFFNAPRNGIAISEINLSAPRIYARGYVTQSVNSFSKQLTLLFFLFSDIGSILMYFFYYFNELQRDHFQRPVCRR